MEKALSFPTVGRGDLLMNRSQSLTHQKSTSLPNVFRANNNKMATASSGNSNSNRTDNETTQQQQQQQQQQLTVCVVKQLAATSLYNAKSLEELVCQLLPARTGVRQKQFQGLAQRCRLQPRCQQRQRRYHSPKTAATDVTTTLDLLSVTTELTSVGDWLSSVLAHPVWSRRLPAALVAQIHASCGWIHESIIGTSQLPAAIRCYLRAVWIWSHYHHGHSALSTEAANRSSSKGQQQNAHHHLVVTLYRLAACYGRLGEHGLEQVTLRYAIQVATTSLGLIKPGHDKKESSKGTITCTAAMTSSTSQPTKVTFPDLYRRRRQPLQRLPSEPNKELAAAAAHPNVGEPSDLSESVTWESSEDVPLVSALIISNLWILKEEGVRDDTFDSIQQCSCSPFLEDNSSVAEDF